MKINICSRRRGADRDTREETEEGCLKFRKKNKENRPAGQIDIRSKSER